MNNPQPETVDRQEEIHVHESPDYAYKTQIVEEHNAERRLVVGRVASLVWLFFGILMTAILIRVFLKLVAANPANPFATMIYKFTDFFLWPFSGLTVTPSAQGMVLEIPAIIAVFVFALIGWVIVRLIWLIFYQPSARSVRTVEHERD